MLYRTYKSTKFGHEYVKINNMYHGRSKETCFQIFPPERVEQSDDFVEVHPCDILTAIYVKYNELRSQKGISKDFDQPWLINVIEGFYERLGYEDHAKKKFGDEIINSVLVEKGKNGSISFDELSALITDLLSPF